MPLRSTRFNAALALCLVLSLLAVLSSCVVPPSPRSDSAALARGPRTPDATVEFSDGLYGDLYRARAGGDRGTIVLVHGGGFYSGTRSEIALYAHPIMDQLERGFSVLSVDYRLTSGPTNRFPAALQDVSVAIDWVRSEGSANGINPRWVIVAGHSAGGTIAALIGLGSNNPGSPRGTTSAVDGWIAISGFYDLRVDGLAALQGDAWLGADVGPTATAAASAITLVDPADPPGYIIHGAADPWVPSAQAISLGVATLKAGRPAFLELVTDANCNGHVPTCAVNMAFLNTWVDRIAGRT